MFHILEQLELCKRIPKADRLQLRQQIKKGDQHLVEMFKSLTLQQLQTSLRKHLAKKKQDKENDKVRLYIQQRTAERERLRDKEKLKKPVNNYKFQQYKQYWDNNLQKKQEKEEILNPEIKNEQFEDNELEFVDQFPNDPFWIFQGEVSQQVMRYFFTDQPIVNRQSFCRKFRKYLSDIGYKFTDPLIQTYFDLLIQLRPLTSKQGVHLDISTFGDAIEPYTQSKNNRVRELFSRLDIQKCGYVNKFRFNNPQWNGLFQCANYDLRATISYWQLYFVRNKEEYLRFQNWFTSTNDI